MHTEEGMGDNASREGWPFAWRHYTLNYLYLNWSQTMVDEHTVNSTDA